MKLELRSERRDDGIMALWLDSPTRKVVVLDAWLIDQLHLFFDELDRAAPPRGFVLLSASSRVFVAGADLAEIDSLNDEQLHAYLTNGADAFARLAVLPCPTVAAVNGATLGGGLEIAMHCDAIIAQMPPEGVKPYRVGLPEAGLGLCPGWGGTQMLPARIDPMAAIEMTVIGFTPTVTEMPEGLFAQVVNADADLLAASCEWIGTHPKLVPRRTPLCIDDTNRAHVARGLDSIREKLPDTPASHAVVEAVEIGLAEGWSAAVAAERRLLVSLRHTEPARTRLEAFFAKNA